ncbi:sphingosine-1-phosphate lyase 1-like [Antedon mediterranea]|uniref:sphingosine-1-phosphate lyase 1-like n=1 Tax=Antedon mediterranea TaxID=105859 RepID=UPI003AF8755A
MEYDEVLRSLGIYWEIFLLYCNEFKEKINSNCEGLEAWQLIAFSVGITLIVTWIYQWLNHPELTLSQRIKKSIFTCVRSMPYIKGRIKEQLDVAKAGLQEELFRGTEGSTYITALPKHGLTRKEILKSVKDYQKLDKVDWKGGKVSGCVYNGSDALSKLSGEIYEEFAWTNPLHPDVFPALRKMESEVVAMCVKMFNGGSQGCGTVTSGGTESILMACLAYRSIWFEKGILYPEILAPISVHSAFNKAAHYFKMKLVHVPIDPVTSEVNIKAMKRLITKKTCMLVGSAPSFPHGILDPIGDIAALGRRYGIPVHVDCCLGGFLVPFMKKAGFTIPACDFTVDGVTSISADTHKYGFAPKGSSVILYSDRKYRAQQYYVNPDWQGGIYASPGLAGSRAGALVAGCWATLVHFGENGYIDSTRKIVSTARYIEKHLRQIKGIFIYGKPEVSVVAVGSNDFDVYRLSGALTGKGWNLNVLQFPASFHLCVTLCQTEEGVADEFIQDVKKLTAEIMKDPKKKADGAAAIYGMSQSVPDRSMVSEIAQVFLDSCFSTGPLATNGTTN